MNIFNPAPRLDTLRMLDKRGTKALFAYRQGLSIRYAVGYMLTDAALRADPAYMPEIDDDPFTRLLNPLYRICEPATDLLAARDEFERVALGEAMY